MAASATLTIDVNARLAGLEQGLREVQNQTKRTADAIGGVGKLATGMFAGISLGALALEAVRMADAFTGVQSQIKLVTSGTTEAVRVQQQLFEVAQRTRQSFTDLAGTYTSIARAAAETGVSQDRLLKLTETISQAVQISGSSSESARAALVQLGQGLASGALRGEELNSVLEQTPRLAQAIAQGLGVSIGELRKLGEAGELTAEKVIGALERVAPTLAAEFGRVQATASQAFTVAANSVGNLVSKINEATGATSALASALIGISRLADAAVAGMGRATDAQRTGLESQLANAEQTLSTLPENSRRRALLTQQIEQYRKQLGTLNAEQGKTEWGQQTADIDAWAKSVQNAAKPSAAFNEVMQKISGVSKDFQKQLTAVHAEYEKGNVTLSEYQKIVTKLIQTETDIGKESAKTKSGGGRTSKAEQEAQRIQQAAQSALDSARRTLALVGEQTNESRMLYETTQGSLAKINPLVKEQLVSLARQTDAREQTLKITERQAELDKTIATALQKSAEADWQMGRQIEDAVDPTIRMRRELEEIARLEREGVLRPEFATIRRYQIEQEIGAMVGPPIPPGLRREVDEVSDAARQLGLTFQSAFEDAIVEGRKFSDVLNGLAQDIMRMVIRKSITEPLAASIAGVLTRNGGLFAGLFGGARAAGGPVAAGKAYLVGERGPEIFQPASSGAIVPNHAIGTRSVSISNTYYVEAGVDRAAMIAIGEQFRRAAVADVRREIGRGGGMQRMA